LRYKKEERTALGNLKYNIQNERGAVLIAALLIFVMLALTGIYTVYQSTTEMRIASNNKVSAQAFYVAEAGIEHAKALLREETLNDVLQGADNNKNNVTDNGRIAELQNGTCGDGTYTVYITDLPATFSNGSLVADGGESWKDSNNRVFITSVGRVGGAQKVIQVEVEKEDLVPPDADGALSIYTPSPVIEIKGSADVSGNNYHVPASFDCGDSSCNGTINPPYGSNIPGVFSENNLTFIEAEAEESEENDNSNDKDNGAGNNKGVTGNGCSISYCPDSIVVGIPKYGNQYWVDLTNQLIAMEGTVTYTAAAASGKSTLGTRDEPQISYVTSEVTFSSTIDGAGILIVRDGVHFTGNSHFEGVIIVLNNENDSEDEISWSTGNPAFYGTLVIAGTQPGTADLRGNPSVNYSSEAIENANKLSTIIKTRSWRDDL